MRFRNAAFLCLAAPFLLVNSKAPGQTDPAPNDSVHVSVIVNQDGSSTGYQVDPSNHKAIATTTETTGKVRTKVEYILDEAGRFGSGKVFGANGKLLFSTVYKYDAAGHLLEEDRFAKDGQSVGKIVYDYNAAGRQTGYSVLDRTGKILGRTSAPKPTPTPKTRR